MKAGDKHTAPSVMILGGNCLGKGAEAMMLTVRDAIKAAFPDAVLWVEPADSMERQRLERYGFRTITRRRQWLVRNVIPFAFGALGVRCPRPVDPEKIGFQGLSNVFRVSNIVVDISGFKSSDQFGSRRAVGRWGGCRLAKLAGNRFVFMPQTWGPFENRWVRLLTRLALRHADLIYARERKSAAYLVQAGCAPSHRVLLSPDIAFQFHANPPEAGRKVLAKAGVTDFSKPLVALTPNMRIFERVPGQGTDNAYLSALVQSVQWFLDNTPCQIVLIAHEAVYRGPNDPHLCAMLLDQIRDRRRAVMLPATESAADVKAVIGLSAFLVASRYHSLIAALSMRVPTAVIGWAHKYDELMHEIKLQEWVVDPVRRSDRKLEDVVIEGWNQRDTIRRALQERVPALEEQSRGALEKMLDVIRSLGPGR
jgi:colanic acid/amylovoran biosynthesis protein